MALLPAGLFFAGFLAGADVGGGQGGAGEDEERQPECRGAVISGAGIFAVIRQLRDYYLNGANRIHTVRTEIIFIAAGAVPILSIAAVNDRCSSAGVILQISVIERIDFSVGHSAIRTLRHLAAGSSATGMFNRIAQYHIAGRAVFGMSLLVLYVAGC